MILTDEDLSDAITEKGSDKNFDEFPIHVRLATHTKLEVIIIFFTSNGRRQIPFNTLVALKIEHKKT